jgi:hypothetical protein
VIWVRGAIWAVIAGHIVARVTLVRISFEGLLAFGEFEGGLGDDLVESKGAGRDGFACVTVANGIVRCYALNTSKCIYQSTWLCCSVSSLASHVVWPQWHFPVNVVMMFRVCGN